jgi:NAD(P)-dependent dehydrogenase (short-subunit alcohol dehydrogenase family)
MLRRFEQRAVLVTGAASGIGRATAERLASEGARVACLDVQAAAAEETAKRVAEAGGEAVALPCDVSDPAAVRRAVDATLARFGALHAVCNVAGILRFANTHDVTLEDWNQILAVNLTGTFLVCQASIPHLLRTRGAIVNMSSTAALAAHPWTAAYSASKGGVLALTHSLAVEYGRQGLRVNAVCAGAIRTPITEAYQVPGGADPKLARRMMPFTGFGDPESAAAAIVFLASDDARHVNGSELRVDGGMLA